MVTGNSFEYVCVAWTFLRIISRSENDSNLMLFLESVYFSEAVTGFQKCGFESDAKKVLWKTCQRKRILT